MKIKLLSLLSIISISLYSNGLKRDIGIILGLNTSAFIAAGFRDDYAYQRAWDRKRHLEPYMHEALVVFQLSLVLQGLCVACNPTSDNAVMVNFFVDLAARVSLSAAVGCAWLCGHMGLKWANLCYKDYRFCQDMLKETTLQKIERINTCIIHLPASQKEENKPLSLRALAARKILQDSPLDYADLYETHMKKDYEDLCDGYSSIGALVPFLKKKSEKRKQDLLDLMEKNLSVFLNVKNKLKSLSHL